MDIEKIDEITFKLAQRNAGRGEGTISVVLSWIAIAFCSSLAYWWGVTHPLRAASPQVAAAAVAGLAGAICILHVLFYYYYYSDYVWRQRMDNTEIEYMKLKHRLENRDKIVRRKFRVWQIGEERRERNREKKARSGRFNWGGAGYLDEFEDYEPASHTELARRDAFAETEAP